MENLRAQFENVKRQLRAAGKWTLRNWFRWAHLFVIAIAGFIGNPAFIGVALFAGLLWVGVYILGNRKGWPLFKG